MVLGVNKKRPHCVIFESIEPENLKLHVQIEESPKSHIFEDGQGQQKGMVQIL